MTAVLSDRSTALAAVLDHADLVSPPAVALEVAAAANRPDCTPSDLSALLGRDPALAARLLKVVNSCVFGLAAPVTSLDRAVITLGLGQLRSFVLGLSLPILQAGARPDRAMRDFWVSSVSGAMIARELAAHARLRSPDTDMVAGLLRDVGGMLLQRAYPDAWAALGAAPDRRVGRPCEAEEEAIGVSHPAVGHALLKRWNMPDEVAVPILYHHHPERCPAGSRVLADRAKLLYLADMLAHLDAVVEQPDVLERVFAAAKNGYGLDQDGLVGLLQRVAPKVSEFARLLDLDLGGDPDLAAALAPPPAAGGTVHAPGSATVRQPGSRAGKPAPPPSGDGPPEFRPEFIDEFPAGGCRLGPYLLQELLGRGAMGAVFRATDPGLGRDAAVKVVLPEVAAQPDARQRFAREARTAAAVRHENVVGIYAVHAEGTPYLAMEFVRGRSLDDRLKNGPLPAEEVVRVGRQIAAGLAAAHERTVIHRDVKPANVLLAADGGRVVLTDFGVARAADDANLTGHGALVGSPLYMSPEQARGEPIDARSDLFGLGGVLYAMCTGRPPFRRPSVMAVLRAVCDDDPQPLAEARPDLPDWLGRLVHRLLCKTPGERFQTAAEVVAAFDDGGAAPRQTGAGGSGVWGFFRRLFGS